jgi:hypothetical protein
LRQMLDKPDNIYVWACPEQDVGIVENQTIRFTGKTNIHAPDRLYFLKGRDAILGRKYGPNKVAIEGSKYPGIRRVETKADEFYLESELQPTEGVWFNDSDLIGIGAKK